MFEAKWDATTLDGLLAYANGHLRYVDEGALGTSDNHLFDIVVILQVFLRMSTRIVSGFVEFEFDPALGNLHRDSCILPCTSVTAAPRPHGEITHSAAGLSVHTDVDVATWTLCRRTSRVYMSKCRSVLIPREMRLRPFVVSSALDCTVCQSLRGATTKCRCSAGRTRV
jgi:hypothetical protein